MDNLTYSHSVFSAKVVLTHLESGTCLIRLSGELDNLAFRELSVFIEEHLNERDTAVVLDFANLSFADSSSLKLVSGLAARFGTDRCAIFGANPNIRRLLKLGALADGVPEIDETDDWRSVDGQAN